MSTKKADTKKDQKAEERVSMTTFIDDLLVKGLTLEELTEKVKKEQEARGGSRYKNPASIVAHMQHRATRKRDPMKFTVDLEKVEPETVIQVTTE